MSLAAPVVNAAHLLRHFTFTYFPSTDWRRFISPTIVFGRANFQDSEIEQEVVDSVGSYGYQLNRILDALVVLVRQADLDKSSVAEKDLRALYRLLDLADAADEAARRAKAVKTAR